MAIGLLNLIGRGAKRAISSKYFPAVAGTAAVGGAAVAGGAKSGLIQFDPWGEKKTFPWNHNVLNLPKSAH